jgi:hypothetical protein
LTVLLCSHSQVTVHTAQDVDLFAAIWDKIPKSTRILLLHGKESDILLAETIEGMRQRGPGIEAYAQFDVGHAPALLCASQADPIIEFLTK